MKNLIERAKFVVGGEEGASNIEIVVWISVVLVIATLLFTFKDHISTFLGKAGGSVNGLTTTVTNKP